MGDSRSGRAEQKRTENKDIHTSKRSQENRIRRVVIGVRFSLNSHLILVELSFPRQQLGSRPLLPPGQLIIETQLPVFSLLAGKLETKEELGH